ncbi:VC0807 family protein [Nocardioides sp.]|uniref:VC0807 family protein n=1 Tax=Nocardioides sp. TaxID=35761 RepID=UPI002D1FA5A8|nr:VC0807 family protein [Nocardioides sp.]
MHLPSTLQVPHWRTVLRHAMPNVVEGKIVPIVVFLVLLQLFGTTPALLGALAWSLLALGRRSLKRQRITGLLVLTTVGLTARTVAALLTGSLLVYFLQPTVTTALVGLAFVASVALGRPLAEKLVLDLCPIDEETRAHPALRRFFQHVTLWWAFTSAVNFAITLWLLLSHSPTTFVLVKSVLGPITTTVTLGVAFVWFRSLMARSGTRVVFLPA